MTPMYIEDVQPRLQGSNDSNPIIIHGVTAEQFRNYLFVITCLPGDKDHSIITDQTRAYQGGRLISICTLYTDVAILARFFGTVDLEAWAIKALQSMFKNHLNALANSTSCKWTTDAILRLRALSRDTALECPVMPFIEYFIYTSLEDVADPFSPDNLCNAYTCIDLYNAVKKPDTDPELLGCIFLKLLSLGHRSWGWSQCTTRKDKAVLYAAQVRFIDANTELKKLGWLNETLAFFGCDTCRPKLMTAWERYFGDLGQGLGSNLPLKDVSLLSQVANNHWMLYKEFKDVLWGCFSYECMISINALLGKISNNIRELYEEVASVFKEINE